MSSKNSKRGKDSKRSTRSKIKEVKPASKLMGKKSSSRVQPSITSPKVTKSSTKKPKRITDSYLDLSEIGVDSALDDLDSDLTELGSYLSSVAGVSETSQSRSSRKPVLRQSKAASIEEDDENPAKAGFTDKNDGKSEKPEKPANEEMSEKPKFSNQIPTSKEDIEKNTEGYKLIDPSEYHKIKIGDFVKHINAHGYLTLGGYVIMITNDDSDEENGTQISWTMSKYRPGEISGGMRSYTIYEKSVQAIYVKENVDDMILAKLNKHQAYISDISFYLNERFSDFREYMENREREREKRQREKK